MGLTLYILISAYIFSIMFFINFLGVDKENLYNNPLHLKLVVISSILVALMFYSGVKS